MPFYRGRLYSIEDLQKLMFLNRHKDELKIYQIETVDHSSFSRDYIEDNLIITANVVLLLAIDRFVNDFISVSELNLTYDRILTYTRNIDVLGGVKVFTKIMDIATDLHYEPFVATT